MAGAAHGAKSARELYSMAKRQGTWDPEQIPVAQDRADWERLTPGQREQLVKVCSLFFEGETSVADTLPFFVAGMPEPDRRMFLATQLLEEVKHAEFFELYFREVFGKVDTAAYLVDSYRGVLVDELRERAHTIGRALLEGNNEALEHALLLGVAHYMGVVEGLMAVSGYDYFEEMLGTRGIFPRLLEGIRLIRADEGRHLTHGMEYLRTKIAQRPEFAGEVQRLFFEEGGKIPARTQFAFEPNDFQLDQSQMLAIAYAHLAQRSREAGLGS
ncbi:MAG TPA: ribonucleotide-diphosphate reductase subunit beta [Terriglobales bacterium]|nr:ribonucleotide-diphosphate reductase subunit beta [Terriglobales bacterium]